MKRLRMILAAFLIAASVAFSACQTTPDMHSAVPKTAYLYSCNGEPIDTIENVDRFFYNGKFFQLDCRDGKYIYTDLKVIIK